MGKGAPDYTRITEIRGLSPTATLVTIAVDADGQLYAVVKGQYGSTLVPIAVDSSGQLIMVPRGQSGNYMNVDASGFLTSVMKGVDGVTLRTVAVDSTGKILGVLQGDYAGSLKTLAVDSQGRMLAVLTDPEDVFGNPHYMGAAELAARLGSIVTFDRRGQVVWFDDFADGLNKWTISTGGPDSGADLSNTYAHRGPFSARLRNGALADVFVSLERIESTPTLVRLGLESMFGLPATDGILELWLQVYSGTRYTCHEVRYDLPNARLQYLNSSQVWTNAATGVYLTTGLGIFHGFKFVGDIALEKYDRVILGNKSYDLSALSCYGVDSSATPRVVMEVFYRFTSGPTADCYIDSVIFTTNEP